MLDTALDAGSVKKDTRQALGNRTGICAHAPIISYHRCWQLPLPSTPSLLHAAAPPLHIVTHPHYQQRTPPQPCTTTQHSTHIITVPLSALSRSAATKRTSNVVSPHHRLPTYRINQILQLSTPRLRQQPAQQPGSPTTSPA